MNIIRSKRNCISFIADTYTQSKIHYDARVNVNLIEKEIPSNHPPFYLPTLCCYEPTKKNIPFSSTFVFTVTTYFLLCLPCHR